MKDLRILKCSLCVLCFKRATIHLRCVLLSFFYTHVFINLFLIYLFIYNNLSFNNFIIQFNHIIIYNNHYSNLRTHFIDSFID